VVISRDQIIVETLHAVKAGIYSKWLEPQNNPFVFAIAYSLFLYSLPHSLFKLYAIIAFLLLQISIVQVTI